MSTFQSTKLWLVGELGLAKDALHIYVALALFLAAIVAFRWRLGDWRPLLVVLAAAFLGEALDVRDTRAIGRAIEPWRHWHDIWNTMLWPLVLTVLARRGALRITRARGS